MRYALTAVVLALAVAPLGIAQEPPAEQDEADPLEAFEIVVEAELPKGWPEPGPTFEVSVKDYPAYRVAYAEGNAAFWLLFSHIQANQIPMTAPVEMQMKQAPRGYQMVNMGFLYQAQDVGETGTEGKVEVIDVPAMTVVSYGTNGPVSGETYEAVLEQIEARIAELEGWRSTGKLRVLGYNSPMIPENKRYYEIQVILERVPADEGDQAEPADEGEAEKRAADE